MLYNKTKGDLEIRIVVNAKDGKKIREKADAEKLKVNAYIRSLVLKDAYNEA